MAEGALVLVTQTLMQLRSEETTLKDNVNIQPFSLPNQFGGMLRDAGSIDDQSQDKMFSDSSLL